MYPSLSSDNSVDCAKGNTDTSADLGLGDPDDIMETENLLDSCVGQPRIPILLSRRKGAVIFHVPMVFAGGDPCKIRGGILCWIPIKMCRLIARRAWTNECLKDKTVNEILPASTCLAEADFQVAAIARLDAHD